jgi:type I restriction enzyme S subunit
MQSEAVPFKHPWKETNLGSVSVIEVGGTPSTAIPAFWSGGDIPWMSSGDVHQRRIVDVPGRITKLGFQSSNAKLIEPPAVAMALAGQGKTRGTVALTLLQVCTNQSVALVKGQDGVLDTSFLFHALDARYEELRARSAGGGRAGLSKAIIEAIPIPLPSLEEQQRITEILDTVDETIALTSSLIAKLKQIRAGLLHDLLTRGLDEDGKLRDAITHPEQFKDSPLGRIPKDWRWDMARLLCNEIVVGVVCNATNSYIGQGRQGIPFLRSQNIRPNYIDTNGLLYISSSFNALQSKSILHSGDVIIVRTGYPGTASVVPEELEGANCFSLIVARPNYLILDPHFFAQYLNSENCKTFINRAHFGSAQHNFNIREMDKLPILVPPLSEQVDIVNRINTYDTRIRTEEAYLDKLKLQKKGLMHDLLTGRVRVNTLQQVRA